ncbi:cyclic nucleotide-binding domain-containing protein 1 [Lingula anatina]|uniref:Cyclic nucleotide-binding domain-containing protein 1 n=1 Tax=Lingula anatina TaxID=7574 RepID=A0A1S3K6B8_LINAN|nr:cyclic nucleotide-binding domain-containing protein 1 [Lingula anatina]|eukprot:XP_013418178.1 cyclic nucleotide-binding domain-containing protein 1 [Lingula anatina]
MSLVNVTDGTVALPTNYSVDKSIKHRLPALQATPVLDYDFLRRLCKDPGLQNRHNPETTEEAHEHFMKNYHKMFIDPHAHLKSKPPGELNTGERKKKASHPSLISHATGGYTGNVPAMKDFPQKSYPIDTITHNVGDYLPFLHKERKISDPKHVRKQGIKTLRRLTRKYPFERTTDENKVIFDILKKMPVITRQVPSERVLKELAVVVTIDIWKEPEFTVFGNTGLHLILKGSVSPLAIPYVRTESNVAAFNRVPTPTPFEEDVLTVGEVFGTLVKVEGREPNSRLLTVKTLEPNCEFLRITTTDYKRVIEQIENRDQTEKTNVLSFCSSYKYWPRQPLLALANLIEWTSFQANTVLVSEGFNAPFIGFIRSGECHVLRQVDVKHTLPNGKQEQRTKQVVMGKLTESQSFGEISVLLDEPMTCSIVASTHLEMGIIDPTKLKELDEVTLQLLKQSNQRTFGNLTQEDIHEEYMQQELKREWNEYKHSIVVDAINTRGIRPGYGKWAK